MQPKLSQSTHCLQKSSISNYSSSGCSYLAALSTRFRLLDLPRPAPPRPLVAPVLRNESRAACPLVVELFGLSWLVYNSYRDGLAGWQAGCAPNGCGAAFSTGKAKDFVASALCLQLRPTAKIWRH